MPPSVPEVIEEVEEEEAVKTPKKVLAETSAKEEIKQKTPVKEEIKQITPAKEEITQRTPAKEETKPETPAKEEIKQKTPAKEEVKPKTPSKPETPKTEAVANKENVATKLTPGKLNHSQKIAANAAAKLTPGKPNYSAKLAANSANHTVLAKAAEVEKAELDKSLHEATDKVISSTNDVIASMRKELAARNSLIAAIQIPRQKPKSGKFWKEGRNAFR